MITDAQVDELAQILRTAYVMTLLSSNTGGFTMVPWNNLFAREKAPYVAQAVAAFKHFRGKHD